MNDLIETVFLTIRRRFAVARQADELRAAKPQPMFKSTTDYKKTCSDGQRPIANDFTNFLCSLRSFAAKKSRTGILPVYS